MILRGPDDRPVAECIEEPGTEVIFSDELLDQADPRWLTIEGERSRITVRASNGTWHYKVIGHDHYRALTITQRI